MKNGWEKKANMESIRSAVSRATHLLGLLLDPPDLRGMASLFIGAPNFHARVFIIRRGPV